MQSTPAKSCQPVNLLCLTPLIHLSFPAVNRVLIVCIDYASLEIAMKPSAILNLRRSAIRETTARYRVANLRIFGSVLHGDDHDGSDLDLLVDALPGATLFDLGGLQVELESLLGIHVDLLTPGDLPQKFRAQILADKRTQQAVIMNLVIIGEAAGKIMDEYTNLLSLTC